MTTTASLSNSIDDLLLGDLAGAQLDQLQLSMPFYGHKLVITTSVGQSDMKAGRSDKPERFGVWHVSVANKKSTFTWRPIAKAVADAKRWAHEVLGIPLPPEPARQETEVASTP